MLISDVAEGSSADVVLLALAIKLPNRDRLDGRWMKTSLLALNPNISEGVLSLKNKNINH